MKKKSYSQLGEGSYFIGKGKQGQSTIANKSKNKTDDINFFYCTGLDGREAESEIKAGLYSVKKKGWIRIWFCV